MSAPGTPMPAADKRLLVHAYVDGELAAAEALALKLEIDSDARLAAEAENAAMLSQVLSRKFPAAAVPDNLRKRIDAEIGVRSKVARPTWMALAAAIVLRRRRRANTVNPGGRPGMRGPASDMNATMASGE